MTENFELVTITSIILILTFISFTPLIYLKYFKDLNNNIEIYNNICNNKSNVYINEVKIKNTYMWNISNVFFDFNRLEKYFHGKTASENTDKKEINRFFSIIDGELNIMKIYNDYLHYSLPLFIVLWLVKRKFLFKFLFKENFTYSLVIYLVIFTIRFIISLIIF